MPRAAQRLDPIDDDRAAARPLDLRAHRGQEPGEIRHLGLAGRIFEDSPAVRQRGGHEQVLGARNGNGIEYDMRTAQAVGTRLDEAVFDGHLRTHCLQARYVQVHGPRADRAAARQGDVGLTETGDQRTQHENRGAHGLHEFVRRLAAIHSPGIDFDAEPVIDRHFRPHHLQQRQHRRHVLEVRDIADDDRARGQQGSGEYGQGGILGARDVYRAGEPDAAADRQLIQAAAPRPPRATPRASAP